MASLFPDRASRYAADKAAKDARARDELIAKNKSRRLELDEAAKNDPKVVAELKHKLEVKEQLRKDREAKTAVLRRIEQDKLDRKQRAVAKDGGKAYF